MTSRYHECDVIEQDGKIEKVGVTQICKMCKTN